MNKASRVTRVGYRLVSLQFRRLALLAARDRANTEVHSNADTDGIHNPGGARQVLRRAVNVLVEVDDTMCVPPLLRPGLRSDIRRDSRCGASRNNCGED